MTPRDRVLAYAARRLEAAAYHTEVARRILAVCDADPVLQQRAETAQGALEDLSEALTLPRRVEGLRRRSGAEAAAPARPPR